MADSVLLELGIIVATALILSLVFHRLGLPMIAGQISAGILIGPYGPFGTSLIQHTDVIQLLASLGIILLLFVIGLEFDPREISKIGTKALVLTITEFLVAFVVGFSSGTALGWKISDSFLLGVLLSISSTAIIAKITLDRPRGSEYGEASAIMTVLIVEDIIAVLLLLLIPELSIGNTIGFLPIVSIAVKGAVLSLATIGFGRLIAPRIINVVSQHEIDVGETTFLLALSFAFVFATLSDYLGFSPAIGAFLLGLTVLGKHSRYLKEKTAPLKDLFVVFFFVSMGMLIDIRSALLLGPALVLVLLGAVGGKFFGGALGSKLIKIGSPITIGATLIPRGEFSLVLAKAAADAGYGSSVIYPVIGLTVLVTSFSPMLSSRIRKTSIHQELRAENARSSEPAGEIGGFPSRFPVKDTLIGTKAAVVDNIRMSHPSKGSIEETLT
jgi:monovalent cation:H+ antiporter-2, CPA2 family